MFSEIGRPSDVRVSPLPGLHAGVDVGTHGDRRRRTAPGARPPRFPRMGRFPDCGSHGDFAPVATFRRKDEGADPRWCGDFLDCRGRRNRAPRDCARARSGPESHQPDRIARKILTRESAMCLSSRPLATRRTAGAGPAARAPDRGVPGRHLRGAKDSRPGLNRLIADAQPGDLILVHHPGSAEPGGVVHQFLIEEAILKTGATIEYALLPLLVCHCGARPSRNG